MFDTIIESGKHRARNDAVFANLIRAMEDMIDSQHYSELDFVVAARLAKEKSDQRKFENEWQRCTAHYTMPSTFIKPQSEQEQP